MPLGPRLSEPRPSRRVIIAGITGIVAGIGYYANRGRPNHLPVIETRTKINHKDNAEMILIPAGDFLMGAAADDEDANDYEKPQRTLYLDAYFIYKYEVTVAQFRQFTRDSGALGYRSVFGKDYDWVKMKPLGWDWMDKHPMVNVDWHQANAYCRWVGGSLPTEAQWEKAARGTDGRKYPWGNVWDSRKCQSSKSSYGDIKSTASVGSFPEGQSPSGVMDMAGNVWEWCNDYYEKDYYKTAPNRNPMGPTSGDHRVLRGGSWHYYDPLYFRSTVRSYDEPVLKGKFYGFRCASGPKE